MQVHHFQYLQFMWAWRVHFELIAGQFINSKMFCEPKGSSWWFIFLCSLAHGTSTNASLLGSIILSLTGAHSEYVTLRTPQTHTHCNLLHHLLQLSLAGHLLEQLTPQNKGDLFLVRLGSFPLILSFSNDLLRMISALLNSWVAAESFSQDLRFFQHPGTLFRAA